MLGSLIASEGVKSEDWTDSDGRFSFERVAPGEYELIVQPGRRGEDQAPLAGSDPLLIEVIDGRIERGLKIELPPALTIKGMVVDSTGTPIAGASIAGARNGTRDPRPARTKSKEDGSFELSPVSIGTYTLSCTAKDFSAPLPVEVEVGESGGETRIVMDAGVEVRLLVLGSSGEPVRGARGQLTPLGGGAGVVTDVGGAFGGLFSGEGSTGEDGRAVLGRYRPGRYRLEVYRGFQRVNIPEVDLEEGAEVKDLTIRLP
jgi:hypothetical protein